MNVDIGVLRRWNICFLPSPSNAEDNTGNNQGQDDNASNDDSNNSSSSHTTIVVVAVGLIIGAVAPVVTTIVIAVVVLAMGRHLLRFCNYYRPFLFQKHATSMNF